MHKRGVIMSQVVKPRMSLKKIQHTLANPSISWKAKGLFMYLASLPNGQYVAESHLPKCATDGFGSVRSGIRELESSGAIKMKRFKTPDGSNVLWLLKNI